MSCGVQPSFLARMVMGTPEDFLLLQAQVADIDVGGHIHPRQVADVHRPVGVRQGRCHRGTFEILFHIWLCFIIVIVRLKGYFAEIVQR